MAACTKSEVNGARMGAALEKHQVAEASLVGDQDVLISESKFLDLDIGQGPQVVGSDAGDVRAAAVQVFRHSRIGTGVDKEPHAEAMSESASARGCCSTTARA